MRSIRKKSSSGCIGPSGMQARSFSGSAWRHVGASGPLFSALNLANPLPFLPSHAHGRQIAGIENMAGGFDQLSEFERVPGVACAVGDTLKNAGVTITINHSARASVANEPRFIPIMDVAHRRLPRMASIKIKFPIEMKILVSVKAAESFLFACHTGDNPEVVANLSSSCWRTPPNKSK